MANEGTTPKILIVEDDPVQNEFLVEFLERLGYEPVSASTCAEGVAAFERGRFTCVLVDLHLPDGRGQDLIDSFSREDPELVSVVLTGDENAETVIDTLRAGAFDYLTKPVSVTTLKASLSRATEHHNLRRERANLLRLLLEEREQLRARVEAATQDIRQYASACELSNARLRSLLELTRLSRRYLSEEDLLQRVFEHLESRTQLQAAVLCDVTRQRIIGCARGKDGTPAFSASDAAFQSSTYDPLMAEVEPEQVMRNWLERSMGFDARGATPFVYNQEFQDRTVVVVAFYLEEDQAGQSALDEFLDMCAYFLAFEWEQAKLLLHIAHLASLGNIAVEMARGFIQPLTAIRAVTEVLKESAVSPEAAEGAVIIQENADRLRRQMQEFQKLTLFREDSVQTVRLEEHLDQALDMLAVAIRNRNVKIEKDYDAGGECILLNGALLARAFLDLILCVLRAIEIGGTLALRLTSIDRDYVAVDIVNRANGMGLASETGGATGVVQTDPSLELITRSVHSCGGKLSVDRAGGDSVRVRITLPRNITRVRGDARRESR